MEERIAKIVATANQIEAVMLWPYEFDGATKWLGCLVNQDMEQIQGSTCWKPYDTIHEVLDSLQRSANTLRQREEDERG